MDAARGRSRERGSIFVGRRTILKSAINEAEMPGENEKEAAKATSCKNEYACLCLAFDRDERNHLSGFLVVRVIEKEFGSGLIRIDLLLEELSCDLAAFQ